MNEFGQLELYAIQQNMMASEGCGIESRWGDFTFFILSVV
jgi:hypothetical protein